VRYARQTMNDSYQRQSRTKAANPTFIFTFNIRYFTDSAPHSGLFDVCTYSNYEYGRIALYLSSTVGTEFWYSVERTLVLALEPTANSQYYLVVQYSSPVSTDLDRVYGLLLLPFVCV
jgi:hypothetical protein